MITRAKREELKKYQNARKNLSEEEVILLDMRENELKEQLEEANDIHGVLFSEEHDFHYDSVADANDRRRGINPMSKEYILKTNNRRKEMGIEPLTSDGHAPNDDTFEFILHALINDEQPLIDNLIEIYGKH